MAAWGKGRLIAGLYSVRSGYWFSQPHSQENGIELTMLSWQDCMSIALAEMVGPLLWTKAGVGPGRPDFSSALCYANSWHFVSPIWSLMRPAIFRPILPLIFLALAGACGASHAKTDGLDSSVTNEKVVQSIVLNPDGTFVATIDDVKLVNEERGIKLVAQRPLPYNRSLENLEVVKAYTEKPDGRQIQVTADQIKEQQEARSASAPMFQDRRVKVVIFPDVAVGDRVAIQFKLTRSTPLFPGHFEDLTAPSFHPYKQLQVIYDVPQGMSLYSDARGFALTESSTIGGRKKYQWDYTGGDRNRIERGSVSFLDYSDRLAVSTFSGYEGLAKAYEERAHDKTAITPDIRQLAEKITSHLSDSKEKALALSDWVRKNIRYVAVYVGPGGVVPHSAESVLANRYGDCKDHVVLLEALLSSVGIESTGALVNLGNAYALPKVPTLGVFNHIITYIPSLDLYLDSTAEAVAAGYLAPLELDKPTLLTRSAKLVHTPIHQPGGIKTSLHVKVDETGKAEFTYVSNLHGWAAETNRAIMRNTKEGDRKLIVERILQQRGQNGGGTITADEHGGSRDAYSVTVNGRIENMVNLPGPIGIPAATGFLSGIGQTVSALTIEKERVLPFTCIATDLEEEASFQLPDAIEIVALPKGISMRTAYIDFLSTYERQGQSIMVKRVYRFHHAGATCTPAEFKAMSPDLYRVINDLRSQIIVQAKT